MVTPPVLPGLHGPEGSPLRRLRSVMVFFVAVLLVVGVVAAALGRWLPVVWALALVAVFVLGHLWSWPRRDGHLDPHATYTPTVRAAVASGLAVGTASGFAVVLQGGNATQGLLQSLVTAVVVTPLLLLLGWWQQRRATSS